MKKLLSLTLLLACTISNNVFASPVASITPASQKIPPAQTAASKAKDIIIPPAEEASSWEQVSYNDKLKVYIETRSLKYDKNTGIITAWTKYTYNLSRSDNVREVLLLSKYDVRMKTCADLYFFNYGRNKNLLKSGPSQDQSWFSLAEGTVGEDILQVLNNYLIAS